jgi:hypothetical protein
MDQRPVARRAGLLIESIDDEVLVYDTERHRAHALNRAAAEMWRRCDGATRPAEIAERLSETLGGPVTEEFVRHGLDQLREFNLLEESPATIAESRPSRRDLILASGLAALTLPLVTSIVAPTAAEAQSGNPTGPTGPSGP